MKAFNIFKPDMIIDKEALRYYFNYLEKELKIETQQLYKISNWTSLCKTLYEDDLKDQNLGKEQEMIKRKQLLITILGYHLFYKNKMAAVNLYELDMNNLDLVLFKLNAFKKELRKKYVYDTDKYYLKILNWSDVDIEKPLNQIDLNLIRTKHIIVPSTANIKESEYSMIFFNKLHFPNPNVESLGKELKLLKASGVIEKDNILKKEIIIH